MKTCPFAASSFNPIDCREFETLSSPCEAVILSSPSNDLAYLGTYFKEIIRSKDQFPILKAFINLPLLTFVKDALQGDYRWKKDVSISDLKFNLNAGIFFKNLIREIYI